MGSLRRFRSCCLGIAFGVAVLGGVSLSEPVAAQEGEVESLFDSGLQSYRQGEFTEAKAAFERAFSQNPSDDVIFGWLQKVSVAQITKMIRESDPEIAGIGIEILSGARKHQRSRIGDPQVVRQAVAEVLALDGKEQLVKMQQYTDEMGRNLVPALVPVLGEPDIGRRAVAFSWIARIGQDAVPPLVTAWEHPDLRIRVNVAKLLRSPPLRHPYVLAYLKAMMETDEVPEAREEAAESFRLVIEEWGRGRDGARPAKVLFLRNARMLYLNPERNAFADASYASKVYRLEGDTILSEEVAPFQLSERMAMLNLEQALRLDPAFLGAHVLNVVNDSAQVVEYDHNRSWYEKQGGFEGLSQILRAQETWVDSVLRLRTLAAPRDVLFDALGLALADRRTSVARYVLDRIRERKFQGPVPPVLVEALRNEDSRLVRIAAAITLAEWNRGESFDAGADVVSALSSAVVQSGVRTVIKALGNQDTANRLDRVLARLNMESRHHLTTASQAYSTTLDMPPDLVLVDSELRLDISRPNAVKPVAVLINQLRANYRTADVPIAVVVPPSELDRASQDYEDPERKVAVIPSDIDAQTFSRTVVEPFFSEEDDAKALALELATEAAKAIERLSESPSPDVPLEESVEALRAVLFNRPDVVRLPCIRALGSLGAAPVVPELAQLYADPTNSPEIRGQAMVAVGRILSRTASAVPAPVASVILEGARAADLRLRKAAWMAFADSGLAAEERLDLYTSAPPAAVAAAPAPAGATEPADIEEEPVAPEPAGTSADDGLGGLGVDDTETATEDAPEDDLDLDIGDFDF